MEGEVILFYWCNVLQFNATWVEALTREAADRVVIFLICQLDGCLILHPILHSGPHLNVSFDAYVGLAYLVWVMHLVCELCRGTPGDPSMSVPRGG